MVGFTGVWRLPVQEVGVIVVESEDEVSCFHTAFPSLQSFVQLEINKMALKGSRLTMSFQMSSSQRSAAPGVGSDNAQSMLTGKRAPSRGGRPRVRPSQLYGPMRMPASY